MDFRSLLNMLTKMFVKSAFDVGLDYASRRRKPDSEMTPEEREQAKSGRDFASRAREVQKVMRRLWR